MDSGSITVVWNGVGFNGQKRWMQVQVGTENQFIVGYSLHQRPTDTRCLIPHLRQLKEKLGKIPKTIIADAGYGGEENYAFLEQEELVGFVKYNTFHKERSKAWRANTSKVENWDYDEKADEWTCPNGQKLMFHRESTGRTEAGYETRVRIYKSGNCEGCSIRDKCTKSAGNREIRVSMKYLQYKQRAREQLLSDEGRALSTRRMVEIESVFGQIKNNRGFRRFLLRGLPKVTLEVGWLSLAHNLLKKAAVDGRRRA